MPLAHLFRFEPDLVNFRLATRVNGAKTWLMLKRLLAPLCVFVGLASTAHAEITTLSAPDAHVAAQKGQVVLIDVRTASEWAMTGLPEGARRADMQQPDFVDQVLGAVAGDFDAPVALIGRTGQRSLQAAQDLAESGFTNISNVAEGVAGHPSAGPGWMARNLPVTTYQVD